MRTIEKDLKNLMKVSRANGIAYATAIMAVSEKRDPELKEATRLMEEGSDLMLEIYNDILDRVAKGK